MKIEYKISGSGGDYSTLVDESAGGTVEPWEPSYSAKNQIEDLASNVGQGASVFTNNLGNIRCSLSLRKVCVLYPTLDAAMAASRTVPSAFLGQLLNLKVTQGSEIQFFPNCVTNSMKPNVQGANVEYSIELVSKMVTNIEPA